jgi:hypothetical protein
MPRTIHMRPITPYVHKPHMSDKFNEYNRKRWEAHNAKLAALQVSKSLPRIASIRNHLKQIQRKYGDSVLYMGLHIDNIHRDLDRIEELIRDDKK